MASTIKLRRGLKQAWLDAHPIVLHVGEPGLETDTNKIKYGDGVTEWRDLPYAVDTATTSRLGVVKVGSNLTVDAAGIINVPVATTSTVGTIKLGNGFVLDVDNKIRTTRLVATDHNYRLELLEGGTLRLPDGSEVIGSTLKGVSGTSGLNYTGMTIGPSVGNSENTWVWIDASNAYIATDSYNNNYTWTFDSDGNLTLPIDGEIRNSAGQTIAGGTSNSQLVNGAHIATLNPDSSVTIPSIIKSTGSNTLKVKSTTTVELEADTRVSVTTSPFKFASMPTGTAEVGLNLVGLIGYAGGNTIGAGTVGTGLGNPLWGAAINANPADYEVVFSNNSVYNIATCVSVGTVSGGSRWNLTGTWPGTVTFPITIRSKNYAAATGRTKISASNGDIIYNTDASDLQIFVTNQWHDIVRTQYNNDIVLKSGGNLRKTGGQRAVFEDEIPRDISDLTDNGMLLSGGVALDSIDIDGGAASTFYLSSLVFADGGSSGSRFGAGSSGYDGGSGAGNDMYDNTLNGGGA